MAAWVEGRVAGKRQWTGSLVSIEDLLFYKTSADSFDTRSRRPGRTGGFLLEYTPFDRLTVTDKSTGALDHQTSLF